MHNTVRKEILKYCREGNTIMMDNALERLRRPGMIWMMIGYDRRSISLRLLITNDIEYNVTMRLFRKTRISHIKNEEKDKMIKRYIMAILESPPGFLYEEYNINDLIPDNEV